GPEHDRAVDAKRDSELSRAGLQVFRVSNAEVAAGVGPGLAALKTYLLSTFLPQVHSAGGWAEGTAGGRLALACTWVAKLQLAVLRGIRSGFLPAGDDMWRIRVHGDLPIARAAFWDLLD